MPHPLRPELLQRPEMVALRRLPPPQLRHLFKQLARDVGTINHHQYMDLVRTSTPADPPWTALVPRFSPKVPLIFQLPNSPVKQDQETKAELRIWYIWGS